MDAGFYGAEGSSTSTGTLKRGISQPIPRHREINELLAKKIIRDLTEK